MFNASRTTLDLCGQAMMVMGIGMPLAIAFPGWMWVGPGSILILILLLAIVHERWLTRERHQLILSALREIVALSSSAGADERQHRGKRARGGGKKK
ncbi:hypothetical protein [Longimicrobium sp.]|uniref:hypothetical protein n=1 Tax=Longimicrobium sp. TaxID=2029185 RepID=UPI002E3092EC|nr:hypothetical protein [Longimicrobium sp.]HEX6038011.1 hypothetical protein [Longimicrobium sp.]